MFPPSDDRQRQCCMNSWGRYRKTNCSRGKRSCNVSSWDSSQFCLDCLSTEVHSWKQWQSMWYFETSPCQLHWTENNSSLTTDPNKPTQAVVNIRSSYKSLFRQKRCIKEISTCYQEINLWSTGFIQQCCCLQTFRSEEENYPVISGQTQRFKCLLTDQEAEVGLGAVQTCHQLFVTNMLNHVSVEKLLYVREQSNVPWGVHLCLSVLLREKLPPVLFTHIHTYGTRTF